MANFTENKINTIWSKAKIVEKIVVDGKEITLNPSKYRQDACGAWIEFDEYGKQTNFGWEIDHSFPISQGGTDHAENLMAFHWKNNKSKADSFPTFKVVTIAEGNKNIEVEQERYFMESFVNKIKQLYPTNYELQQIISKQE